MARLDAAGLAGARRDAILDVFEDYLRVARGDAGVGVKRLEADSRLAWLPFQLALRDEQHDTQEEIDAIVSRAQRTPLVGGNTVFYWAGQQFQLSCSGDPRGPRTTTFSGSTTTTASTGPATPTWSATTSASRAT